MSLSIPLLPLRRASSFRRLRLLLHSSLALTLPFSFLFICQFLPASRVTPCAQVFPALLFRVVPNRTGRFRFATGTLLPTQRDQLFIVTIHAQIPAIHCLTPQPTPGRLIASARDARVRRNRRAFAIVTSMAQTDSSFDAGVVPTRGRLLASTRTADFILEFRQFFVIALATQALALYHFRPVPAPVGFSAVAHRALFIRQHDLLGSVTRLTDIRALNDCLGRENDRAIGECFCERHTHTHREKERERETGFAIYEFQSTSFPNEDARYKTHFQIFPIKARSREPPDGSLDAKRPRPPFFEPRARFLGLLSRGGFSFLDAVVDVTSSSSTTLRIGLQKFGLITFTLFPSNVCVVPMLAFFVYARFFLPNTRRRSHIGPTRRWCFRHSIEREDEEEEEEEIRIDEREREREREKGEEPLFHV